VEIGERWRPPHRLPPGCEFPAELASYGDRAPPGAGSPVSTFLPIGDDILLLLDQNLKPRVGDGAFSFTLSRTN